MKRHMRLTAAESINANAVSENLGRVYFYSILFIFKKFQFEYTDRMRVSLNTSCT